MITQELRDYIRQQLGVGVAKDAIRQALSAVGWSDLDLNDAFPVIEKPQSPQIVVHPPITPSQVIQPSIQPTQEPMQNYAQHGTSSGSHKWIWPIAVVVLLLVCAGGAFAAYSYGLFDSLLSSPSSPITVASTPSIDSQNASSTQITPTTTSDTANWETYEDENGIFEFKYPPQWIFTNNNADLILKRGETQFSAYLSVKTSDYVSGSKTGAMLLLTAMEQKTPQGIAIPIKECVGYPGLKLVDCPEQNASGTSLIEIGDLIALSGSVNDVNTVAFTYQGVSYSLNFMKSKQFPEGDKIFYQILSTFKFIK